ncbi:hypothetical protein WA026_017748, partial [Henosepilachna vigintioctopunctata]
ESFPSDDFVGSDYVLSNSGTSSEVSSQSSEILSPLEKSFENRTMEPTILKSFTNEGSEGAEEVSDLNQLFEYFLITANYLPLIFLDIY